MRKFLVLNKEHLRGQKSYWVSLREINHSAKPFIVIMSEKNAERIEKAVLKDTSIKNKYSSIKNIANPDKSIITQPIFMPRTIGKKEKQSITWIIMSFSLGTKVEEKNGFFDYIETITMQRKRIKQLENSNERLKSLMKKKSASEEFERGRQSIIAELGLEL